MPSACVAKQVTVFNPEQFSNMDYRIVGLGLGDFRFVAAHGEDARYNEGGHA